MGLVRIAEKSRVCGKDTMPCNVGRLAGLKQNGIGTNGAGTDRENVVSTRNLLERDLHRLFVLIRDVPGEDAVAAKPVGVG